MEHNKPLTGRLAVVTGASSGLGRAIATKLSDSGADIVAIDLPAALDGIPSNWRTEPIDLGHDRAADALSELAQRLGKVDVVVANAGVVPPWRGIDTLDLAEWDRVMRINVWAVAATIGAFSDALEQSGQGAVVAMASINGYRAHPKQVLYTASKHAVIGVVRAAALDLGTRKIRVNALAPGPIATEALMGRLQTRHEQGGPTPYEAMAALQAEAALGRIATEEDVANAALFLASAASGGMTGVVLPVEAGLS